MRFNNILKRRHRIPNRAGGDAFVLDPRMEGATLLLTSMVQDQYYRSAEEGIERLRSLIASHADMPLFMAKSALLARNEFGNRSVSHVIAAEVAPFAKGTSWGRTFYDRIIRRPDDITEILAYYGSHVGDLRHPTAAMRKGLGAALTRFDDYQLGKYRRSRAEISLIDAVNLLHPPHTEAIGALMTGALETPETWETRLTRAGGAEDVAEAKGESWRELVRSRTIGYFALLRNLRNILRQAPDVLPEALEMLTDERLIRRSLVFPFRFYTAYRMLESEPGAAPVLQALGRALEIAVRNVPVFENTLVVIDRSGSMSAPIAQRSSVTLAETAALFGVTLARASNADVMIFGDRAAYVTPNPDDSMLTSTRYIGRDVNNSGWNVTSGPYDVGHGTNFHAPLLLASKPYDRIVFFSDMQGWVGYDPPTAPLEKYERRTGARPYIYSIDFTGYGSSQFPNDRTFCLAGFSEKIFDMMKVAETDRRVLVNRIESVELV